jgi:sodium/pantothenate symporter
VYGAFGAAFMWPVWFGLFWKRMNRAGAYAGVFVGAAGYVIAKIMDATNPFAVGAALSLVAVLVAVYATSAPPKEAYEAYFEADVSPSTRELAMRIRHESDEAAQEKVSLSAKPTAK